MRLKDISVGKLREQMVLQTIVSASPDSAGRKPRDWDLTNTITIYAEVIPTGGSEVPFGGTQRTRKTYTVITRYDARIDESATQRFVWKGKNLNIDSVGDVEGRGRFYEIHCVQEVSNVL